MIDEIIDLTLVDHRYFIAGIGAFNTTKAKYILASRIQKQGTNKCVSQYYKTDVDKLIAEYRSRFEPAKENELSIHKMAEHFKRSPDYMSIVARNDNFPKHSRLFQERGSRKPFRVWLLEDIEGLKVEDFYSLEPKKIEREPFSWSGIQAEFIRMCRPGGLLANNGDFA